MLAMPLFRVAAAEAYVPLVSVTVPVGVGSPVPALTTMLTVSGCVVLMPFVEGVSATYEPALTTVIGAVVPLPPR